jgi:hypothetical protein
MSLISSQHHPFTNSLLSSTDEVDDNNTLEHTEAALSTLLESFAEHQHLERSFTGYSLSQSGSHSPDLHAFDAQTEETTAKNASFAHNASRQDVNSNKSTSATPTSEYGLYSASAYTGSFPEQTQRPYHPASNSSGDMAQPTSPSSQPDGRSTHHNNQIKSDQDVPIDPSIAASSPTYPPHGGQYSPYPPQQEMQHGYPPHPNSAMYTQPRPDWAGYGGHPQHPMQGGYAVSGAQTPTSAAPAGARSGQVSSSNFHQSPPILQGHWVAHPSHASRGAPGAYPQYPVSFHTREDAREVSAYFLRLLYLCLTPPRSTNVNSLIFHRSTRSSQSLVPNNTNVLAEDTKKSSACTSVDGTAAKRHMAH